MSDQTDQTTVTSVRQQCRHIFTDGHRCGSPCLRREDFCYYHHTSRKPAPRRPRESPGFNIAPPEDRAAIQLTIGEVLARIASEQLDPRRAGLLLYGLQIASGNLPRQAASRTPPEPGTVVEDITEDPELGLLAPPAEFRKADRALNLEEILMKQWALYELNPEAEQNRKIQTEVQT